MGEKEQKITAKSPTALEEEKVLAFWKENRIFEKSLEQTAPQAGSGFLGRFLGKGKKKEFVFYDGPPFATGLPHYGSLLSSIIKDVIPRYKTMCGFYVRRRWGWDCHGLPIENQIEKELGLKTKKDIERIGVEAFNAACRASVLRYTHDWKVFIERVGRWVEFDTAYKTMGITYMESVWWVLKELHKRNLLYEGKKVLLYCPHCETPLAKAEIAMDNTYKDITEEAVTVKFKVKNPTEYGLPENTFLLAWTTTPWTLPGNVALAVGENILYSIVQVSDVVYIIASDLVAKHFTPEIVKVLKEVNGKDFVGLEYEPLFDVPALQSDKSYKIYSADFVSTEEGTGIVHTAVMYGEDDFVLGQKESLPMVQLLDAGGKYNEHAPKLVYGKFIKSAEKDIKEDLEKRGLLFESKSHTHSYPHCYRCGTALIYNALVSWFIAIQKIKQRMLTLNEKVEWFPEHLKHGRFQHIVEGAPDWTISRNRYWASPLPIWKCTACRAVTIVGGMKELAERQHSSGNTYTLMRHGEAENNLTDTVSVREDSAHHRLTARGREEVIHAAEKLKDKKIDVIISSRLPRTRETAEIVAKTLGIPKESIIYDDRIHEFNAGSFEGKTWKEFEAFFVDVRETFLKAAPGGETRLDVKRRAGALLYELETRYEGKRILIVTHDAVVGTLRMVAEGADLERSVAMAEKIAGTTFLDYAGIVDLSFAPLPHNPDFELDIHRPYIDAIELTCACGAVMRRIPEVIDCWVESASMPFAEYHYPFENKEIFESRFPGDFIAEYIAQTRTWFYYMHAIATGLFDSNSFKQVITTGNVLAEDGTKMSKSKGNYTDPMINLDRYGADALRYYLMTSVVMQGEDVRFSDADVRETYNKVVNMLGNVVQFYGMYAEHEARNTHHEAESKNVLDKWILARLAGLYTAVTDGLERYDTVSAARPIRDFVDDLSTWYVRRSRERFKSDDVIDKEGAMTTMRFVLLELSKLIAPFVPFLAERIYKGVGGEKESVHLESWPHFLLTTDHRLLTAMAEVRRVVSLGLEARASAGIKIRQPLRELKVKGGRMRRELAVLIQDELNVRSIVFQKNLKEEVFLDTTITPELKKEGQLRELLRAIQEFRKRSGLTAGEKAALVIRTNDEGKVLVEQFKNEIMRGATLSDVSVESGEGEVRVDEIPFGFGLK